MMRRMKIMLILALTFICFNVYAGEGKHSIYCPVLTYHRLTNDVSQTTDWTTTPEKFEKDIKRLLDNGYTPIFTSDLVSENRAIGQIPEKPVIIQFDEGYESVYELAYPILLKYNVKAEVYIITDYTSEQPTENNGNMFLGWQQLRIMENSGLIYTGLHGKTHLPLTEKFTDEEIKNDFKSAWNTIDVKLGARARYYVYPRGSFDKRTIKLIKEAGGNEQFVWIWDLSKDIKNDVIGRVNIGYNTDVISAISSFEKTYNQKLKSV